jgi:two-component system invasion response regulator UvrY
MPDETLRILIADDHTLVRKGLIEVLREGHAGAEVGEAANGHQAIEMAVKDEWDIVLLDIAMPGANGLEVLRAIKRARPALPVLMLSMHAGEAYVTSALKDGAAGYVSKESAPNELLAAIRAARAGAVYVSRNLWASARP